ncbi:MAG: HAMP domain-containing histidine kinase [Acidobacteria bacterium]|nr:HAMP domain-containing histidine kinase [Acidobacteriota bacterium]
MAEHPTDEWVEAANCLATVAHQLSSVVHEANNLLQVIAGSAEMMQLNSSLPESALKRSATIAEHAHRVSALLGSVRELSRFAPSREGEMTDLSALMRTVLDVRRHALNKAQVGVVVDGLHEPVFARASWRPTMQIVLNLMLNAEAALRHVSGPRLAVRVTRDDAAVSLLIADNGPGFPTNVPGRYALHPQDDEAPRLGLGLDASRWLAQREGGELHVRATPDGTTAALTLRA